MTRDSGRRHPPADQIKQRRARQELHHQEGCSVAVAAEFQHLDDIGMEELGNHPAFVFKAGVRIVVGPQARVQDLGGAFSLGLQVERSIHRTDGTAAQDGFDAVAPGEHSP